MSHSLAYDIARAKQTTGHTTVAIPHAFRSAHEVGLAAASQLDGSRDVLGMTRRCLDAEEIDGEGLF